AEDGIRDFHVTGVQTCALPISALSAGLPATTSVTSSPAAIVRPSCAAASPLSGSTLSPQLSSSGAPARTGSSAGISVTVTLSARSEERRVGKAGCRGGRTVDGG